MRPVLLDLVEVFSQLGLIAVGGVVTILPDMHRQVVDVHHWMDAASFAQLFAITQAAPGPNVMVVGLIGFHEAGLLGAVVALSAFIGPPAVVAYTLARLWNRFRLSPWVRDTQMALTAVSVGLIAAAAATLGVSAATSLVDAVFLVAVTALFVRVRVQPLWVLSAGAMLGALGVL